MGVPDDPARFVADAERAINERDLHATSSVYAPNAVLDSFTDGALERYVGSDAVHRAWDGYLAAMKKRGFSLRKTLVSVGEDTIVNEWKGTLGGRTDARGIELWRFDDKGRVAEHRMYSLLNVKPSESVLQRLRLSLNYPFTAMTFVREQQKRRRR